MSVSKNVQNLAKQLLSESRGLSQEDFGYRAYLRVFETGESGDYLLRQLKGAQLKGAKRAREVLYDIYLGRSASSSLRKIAQEILG